MKHRWNIVFGVVAAVLGYAVVAWDLKKPLPQPRDEEAFELPVPMQEMAVDAGANLPGARGVGIGRLPSPGPNQITDAAKCIPPAKFRDGGCWIAVADEKPPCDPPAGRQRNLWPDGERCWFPVARAAPTPTSGEAHAGSVAAPGK
jgi:hypothetical protein